MIGLLCFSLCAVPGIPQNVNVTSLSSTSLLVTWDHPPAPDRNGVITGYTVNWLKGQEINTIELFSNETSHLLTGLQPFTSYSVAVAGNTSAGQGRYTLPFTIRTLSDSKCGRGAGIVYVCCGGMQKVPFNGKPLQL